MKYKAMLFFFVFLITLAFSDIFKVEKILFDGDISYAATKIEAILNDYGIKEGEMLSDIDAKLASKKIYELGYFTSVHFSYDQENKALIFHLKPNPIVEKIEFAILGDKLVDESYLATQVDIEKGKPLNLKKYAQSLNNIRMAYMKKGYPYVAVGSNLKMEKNNISIEATKINNKNYDDKTLVFIIKEFDLWDLDLRGEYKILNKKEIKKITGLKFRKDWENTFILFRGDVKETYPSIEKLQRAVFQLRKLPYFSENTNITFEPTEVSKTKAGDLILVISGNLRKIINKDKVLIKDIELEGNSSISSEEIFKVLKDSGVEKNKEVGNLQLLNSIKNIQKLYENEGYIFVDVNMNYLEKEQMLKVSIVEKKVGKVFLTFESSPAKTQLYLIKPLVKLKKGEIITKRMVEDTYFALSGTGYFEKVDILPKEKPKEVDFDIILKENEKSGKFFGGLTWSRMEDKPWYYGFMGQLEINWLNPFGYGQKYGIKLQISPISQTYILSLDYNINRVFGSNFDIGFLIDYKTTGSSNGITIENITLEGTPMEKISGGGNIRYYINDFNSIYLGGNYSRYKYITDSTTFGYEDRIEYKVGYIYNRIDYPFRPKKGNYFAINTFGALNPYNKDKQYFGVIAELKKFLTVSKLTVGSRIKLGTNIESEDLWNYNIGGMYSVRLYGFKTLVGNNEVLFNSEIYYPLKSEVPTDLFLFLDFGYAGDEIDIDTILNNYILDFGLGVKFILPMIGPIRFEFGLKKDLDFSWSFGFGPMF